MNEIMNISGIDCYEKDGVAYLKLDTVARGLGFTRIAESGNEVVRWERVEGYLKDLGVPTCGHDGFIPENIFYRLAMKAKNEAAERFQAKVADEIIPTIRKTGGYVNNDELFIQTYLPFADENTKALFRTTLQTISAQNKLIQEQKPFVEFADHISQSTNSIDVGTFAKIISKKFVNVGRTRLFNWLKQNKYLMKDNRPYQQYIDSGYFEVIEQTYKTPYGDVRTSPKTLVTGKGQIYFTEKIKSDFTK